MIHTVIFEKNRLSANEFDKSVLGGVAPVLPILRAIDGVQPNPELAPICYNVDGIAVYDTGDLCCEIAVRLSEHADDF